MPFLFCFGLGYSGALLARYAQKAGFDVCGTSRGTSGGISRRMPSGIRLYRFDDDERVREALAKTTHLVSTVPPSAACEPVLERYGDAVGNIPWICYCSSLSVYGNHQGAWIDETTPPALPLSERGKNRLQAENLWIQQARNTKLCIFRIAAIYGKGRNAIERILRAPCSPSKKVKPIIRSDKVFNRIHVDDLVSAMGCALQRQEVGFFNICDDLPTPAHEVILYASKLLGCEPPAFLDHEQAEQIKKAQDDASPTSLAYDISDLALSFHREHKRARNKRMKEQLGIRLLYPDYRCGLRALLPHSNF